MLTDTRVTYVFLYVRDLAVSRAFYADTLGLRVIEEDDECVKFDVGTAILALNVASQHGIELPDIKDHSTDVVWLVDDIRQATANLTARGVQFKPTDWYQPGGIADFYDPDGRWLTLYQPSLEAMTWPSGDRIKTVIESRRSRTGSAKQLVSQRPDDGATPPGLTDSELIYLFTFVPSSQVAEQFYHKALGLRAIEGGPCSRTSGGDEEGVVKYDTGGVMIATHHVEPQRTQEEFEEHLCPPPELQNGRMRGVAPVFHTRDADAAVRELAESRPDVKPVVTRSSALGVIVRIDDPTGHLVYLYEPSAAALTMPSGRKIEELLAVPLAADVEVATT